MRGISLPAVQLFVIAIENILRGGVGNLTSADIRQRRATTRRCAQATLGRTPDTDVEKPELLSLCPFETSQTSLGQSETLCEGSNLALVPKGLRHSARALRQ